jgi:hypothetical protein
VTEQTKKQSNPSFCVLKIYSFPGRILGRRMERMVNGHGGALG